MSSVHQTQNGRWFAKWYENGKQKKKYFGRGEQGRMSANIYSEHFGSAMSKDIEYLRAKYKEMYANPNHTIADIFDSAMIEIGLPVRFFNLYELLEKAHKEKKKGISVNLRVKVLTRDGRTCQMCGAKAPDVQLHVDHIIPIGRGGLTELRNLQTLCHLCNRGKSDNNVYFMARENMY